MNTFRLLMDGSVVGSTSFRIREPPRVSGLLQKSPAFAHVQAPLSREIQLIDDEGWPLLLDHLVLREVRGDIWIHAHGAVFACGPRIVPPPPSIFEIVVAWCDVERRYIAGVPDVPDACGVGESARAAFERARRSLTHVLPVRFARGQRIHRSEATRRARLTKLALVRSLLDPNDRDDADENAVDVFAQELAARIAEATTIERSEALVREVITRGWGNNVAFRDDLNKAIASAIMRAREDCAVA